MKNEDTNIQVSVQKKCASYTRNQYKSNIPSSTRNYNTSKNKIGGYCLYLNILMQLLPEFAPSMRSNLMKYFQIDKSYLL